MILATFIVEEKMIYKPLSQLELLQLPHSLLLLLLVLLMQQQLLLLNYTTATTPTTSITSTTPTTSNTATTPTATFCGLFMIHVCKSKAFLGALFISTCPCQQ